MNPTTLDPYATLGVPRGATERQVQQAYRRLAKRYHPDLHPDSGSIERMRRVNQAWEILSSPARRASYDAASASSGSASAAHWSAPRRAAPASSASTTWSGTWTPPPPPARASGPPARRPYDDTDGPRWTGVVLAALIGFVAFVALVTGLLPAPFAAIGLLVLVRGLFWRLGEGGR